MFVCFLVVEDHSRRSSQSTSPDRSFRNNMVSPPLFMFPLPIRSSLPSTCSNRRFTLIHQSVVNGDRQIRVQGETIGFTDRHEWNSGILSSLESVQAEEGLGKGMGREKILGSDLFGCGEFLCRVGEWICGFAFAIDFDERLWIQAGGGESSCTKERRVEWKSSRTDVKVVTLFFVFLSFPFVFFDLDHDRTAI